MNKGGIILVGDIHAMDKPPASVYDTYQDDILEMLDYIAKLEDELEADAVVWAGDVFNFPNPARTSHALVLKMVEAVQKFNNLYICIGNHDIRNDRLDSIEETQPLGVLFKAGAKRVEGSSGWVKPEYMKNLPLYIVNWQQDWNNPEAVKEAFADWRAAPVEDQEYSLVVTHAPILPPDQQEDAIFSVVPTHGKNSISEAMNNRGSLYYGHIHEDHGVFEDDGVTYCNVGALSRGALHEYNVKREVQVAYWTPDDGFTPIVIPHKPAEEVFKMEQVQEQKTEKASLDEFLNEVGSATLDITSTESVVAHIQTLSVPPPVKKLATEILQEII